MSKFFIANGMIFLGVFLLLHLPLFYALGLFFNRAGIASWKAYIPIYNAVVLYRMVDRPWYWVFPLLMPGINLIVFWGTIIALYKAFGKEGLQNHTIGVLLFPYYSVVWARDKKVVFLPKEKRYQPGKSQIRNWVEAIVFAVVAATFIKSLTLEAFKIPSSSMEGELLVGDYLFVSKLHYGPRLPITPLSIPFVHNTFPLNSQLKSYVDWWQMPIVRLPGFTHIKRNDVIVFNFPPNDTTINDDRLRAHNYYQKIANIAFRKGLENGLKTRKELVENWGILLQIARKIIRQRFDIITHPIDKRSNYIKRCIGVPGDKIQIINSVVYVNGIRQPFPEKSQFIYKIVGVVPKLPDQLYEMGITYEDQQCERQLPADVQRQASGMNIDYLNLTSKQVDLIKAMPGIDSVIKFTYKSTLNSIGKIFPLHPRFNWSLDNFGPLWVPKAGTTIHLSVDSLPLYRHVITGYENNTLKVKGDEIWINGKKTSTYTFKYDYYFGMGDNRHGSADSRVWGFIPYNHMVGKAAFIWFSVDPQSKGFFPFNFKWWRLNRIFQAVN